MSRVYSCLVALSAAMAVQALADPEITARAVIAQRGESCPYLSVSHQDSKTSIQGCCVGGSDAGQTPFLSVCQGWPICGSNPTTTTWTSTPISCAAMIAYTDANYDAELSSAEKAFSADSTDFCYTVGGADNCAGGAAVAATTTSDAAATGSDAAATGSDAAATGSDAGATGGDAAATGGTAVGSAGTAGSAVNTGNAASNTGTSDSGSSGSSSSSNSGSSGSSSSSSGTSGSSSSGTSASSSTTSTGTSGAKALGLGWGAWALGLAGVGPVVLAVML